MLLPAQVQQVSLSFSADHAGGGQVAKQLQEAKDLPEAVAAIQQGGAFRAESCGAAIGMLRTMQADTDTPGGPYPSSKFPNP
jgi:hypothetical protein